MSPEIPLQRSRSLHSHVDTSHNRNAGVQLSKISHAFASLCESASYSHSAISTHVHSFTFFIASNAELLRSEKPPTRMPSGSSLGHLRTIALGETTLLLLLLSSTERKYNCVNGRTMIPKM